MNRTTYRRALALPAVLGLAFAVAACGASNETSGDSGASSNSTQAQLSGSLDGAGSSAQQAAQQAWAAAFSAVQPDVTVNYDPVGSGGGREQFLAGGIAFAGSDAALKDDELTTAEDVCGTGGVIEMPNYISPIAVIFNLDGITTLNLGPSTIARIFNQQITNWNDPAITADNADQTLPDLAIAPVNRSDDSGTTKNFVDYLLAAAPDDWPYESSGVWPVAGGESAQGTSGVVSAVSGGNGTIGYADASQAGDLGVAKIGVGSEFVEYSPEAAAAVVEASTPVEGRGEYDFALDIARDTTDSGLYPVVLVSYHIMCVENKDQETVDLLKAYFGYIISPEGQAAAADAAGSAPISDALRTQAQTAIDALTVAG
ncbi:MAG: phosphate ABC transporter substrate-binding protein PstS [Geodermatophilaceae bacterium]|nr:phosphate ABC transporter substrate-binding protein PstS [Geodermatophilaceae bacterium]